jgi:hypothetical protein
MKVKRHARRMQMRFTLQTRSADARAGTAWPPPASASG